MEAAGLTDKQEAAASRWWSAQDQKTLVAAWYAAGFTTIFSCMGWGELRRTMPDVADVLGRSVITRYRLRCA